MGDTIKKLFNGEFNLADENVENNNEFHQKNHEQHKLYEEIRNSLKDEQDKAKFEKYVEVMYALQSITNEDYFVKGFKIGSKMAKEIYE